MWLSVCGVRFQRFKVSCFSVEIYHFFIYQHALKHETLKYETLKLFFFDNKDIFLVLPHEIFFAGKTFFRVFKIFGFFFCLLNFLLVERTVFF